jgi:hypothetical protein
MAKVKHIAFFQFKPETTPDQVGQFFDDIMNLTETISGIEDYVWGPNNSPEGLNQNLTHGFVMTFADAAARDAYVEHQEHRAFVARVQPMVEKAVVLDFEV